MERQVKLTALRKDGSTLLQHCISIEKQTGSWPSESPLPEIDPDGAFWWDWYWELRSATAYGQAGPNPISYQEIDCWRRLTARELRLIDIDMIIMLDRSYLNAMNKRLSTR